MALALRGTCSSKSAYFTTNGGSGRDARQAVADAEARCLAAADETAHTFHRLCIANKTILEMSFAEKEFRADLRIFTTKNSRQWAKTVQR